MAITSSISSATTQPMGPSTSCTPSTAMAIPTAAAIRPILSGGTSRNHGRYRCMRAQNQSAIIHSRSAGEDLSPREGRDEASLKLNQRHDLPIQYLDFPASWVAGECI